MLGRAEWHELAGAAEQLFGETLTVETELQRYAQRAGARRFLPSRAWRRIKALPAPDSIAARLVRFDFHPADDGWRLSEVNSDVPAPPERPHGGGFYYG